MRCVFVTGGAGGGTRCCAPTAPVGDGGQHQAVRNTCHLTSCCVQLVCPTRTHLQWASAAVLAFAAACSCTLYSLVWWGFGCEHPVLVVATYAIGSVALGLAGCGFVACRRDDGSPDITVWNVSHQSHPRADAAGQRNEGRSASHVEQERRLLPRWWWCSSSSSSAAQADSESDVEDDQSTIPRECRPLVSSRDGLGRPQRAEGSGGGGVRRWRYAAGARSARWRARGRSSSSNGNGPGEHEEFCFNCLVEECAPAVGVCPPLG
jgi:hypothetical protein